MGIVMITSRIIFNQLTRLLWLIVTKFNFISHLILENIALRQQLAMMKRSRPRPRISLRDRLFWVILSHIWKGWKEALIVVRPETVVKWHRLGFRIFWRWKSRPKGKGRPPITSEIRSLVIQISEANPLWGAPRIHGELLKLGFDISERAVSSLMPKDRFRPPSQTWKTFLKNHMHCTFSIDFFTVPTAFFKILFVFVIISHLRRKVIHFNVTTNPTARWAAQQMIEACPFNEVPKYLIRDRDSNYGEFFRNRIKGMGITEVPISFQSPWQNCYVERLIGSVRRECLDHLIVFNEKHLKKILTSYFEYYNQDRTHLGIGKDSPLERPVQPRPQGGRLIKLPRVGGLHHRYIWKKAA